ncbi:MAG: FKBP-type peptidyl-prolyl cis-trans isomerase [Eubacterium sp.]|nr:FKBP-type peptidyl-prolyl cis-trans isomerase [Eubacterium sp.]
MKIAVTYENGQIFQHFGHTEAFKLYEVEDGKVISSEVIGSNGAGHSALAGLLAQQDISVLICGGLGEGAKNALTQAGIEVFSGAQGDADAAVEAYLKGELVSAGVNCDHHDHEEEHGCDPHGCGSCGGCGGAPQIIFEGKNAGKTCRVHYKGTFNDGSQFDSSYDRGQPLEFICGAGMMIPGFDKAVLEMEVGETVNIHLMPEEAYGMPDPRNVFEIPFTDLPGSEELKAGEQVYLQDPSGQAFPMKVVAVTETTVTFDGNHEMAGKELNFQIELVEIL